MTDTPMTPERERMIRIWHEELCRLTDPTAVARRETLGDLLAEVDRLRGELSDATGQVDFLERNTLPDLHRQIEHHKGGKARWRKRAETAEARVAELTDAPVDEAAELAEGAAELEAMRREHPAPCRVPDSPDCTCPAPRIRRNSGTCTRCGDTAAQWCPDCKACRLGCFATRAANPCTHENAPWSRAASA